MNAREDWREAAVFSDPVSAAAVEGLLRSESIEVRVAADEPVPGLMRSYSVRVPAAQLARAQQVLAQAPLSEEEWAKYAGENDEEQGAP